MSKDGDRAQELFGELLGAVCRDTGLREELAIPFVKSAFAYLQATHGGQRLYIPAPERDDPIVEIVAFYAQSGDADSTCRRFNISRRKLFYLLNADRKNAKKTG